MNRTSIAIFALFTATCALQAQDANPITANLKQSWNNINTLLTKMAEKMPEENYRFKPTGDVQDFGQRMAHVIGFNMRTCAQLKGEQRPLTFNPMPVRSEILEAIHKTTDECDSMFNTMTDAELMKTITGRGGPRLKLAVIEGNLLEHSQEMYGYMAVYLRLKGIVPPSSDRNER